MKRILLGHSLFALVVFALVASPLGQVFSRQAAAQPLEPVVVVSIAGSDELLGDILYLTDSAGVGDFGRLVALMASPYTSTLNRENPAGGYVTMTNGAPASVVFIPVKDLDNLLTTLEPQIGQPDDLGDGVLEIGTDRSQSMFLKESDGWVFVSNDEANLVNLPENPVELLGGLNEKYTVAFRFNATALPAELRLMAAQQIRQGFQDRLDQELDDQDAVAIQEIGGQALQSVVQLIEETDNLTVGWEVDAAAKTTYLDVNFTAVQGTELAGQMALITHAASSFAGFLMPGAALTFHSHATSTEADVEQALAMLARLRVEAMKGIDKDDNLVDDQERQTAKDIVNQLLDIAVDTIKAAKTDLGGTLVLQPGSMAVAAGGFVSDGEQLADALQKLAKLAEAKIPDSPVFTFNAETYQGVTLHKASKPLRTGNEQVRQVLGDPMSIVLGTGKQSVYIAFGQDAEQLLKDILDGSIENKDQQFAPGQLRLSMAPALKFAAAAEQNPAVQAALEAIEAYGDTDGISLTVVPIERGFAVRLQVEEGVLKAVGGAIKARNQR